MDKPNVYVRLRDTGSIFHDTTQNRAVTGKLPVHVRRTPKVAQAIKDGVLDEVKAADAEAEIAKAKGEAKPEGADTALKAVKAENVELKKENETVKAKALEDGNLIAELTGSVETLEGERDALKGKLETTEEDLKTKTEEYNDLKEKFEELEKTVKTLETDLKDKSEAFDNVKGELDKANAALEKAAKK